MLMVQHFVLRIMSLLQMRNGCVENGGYYYTMADCTKNFMNGLLTDGLAAGACPFRQWILVYNDI